MRLCTRTWIPLGILLSTLVVCPPVLAQGASTGCQYTQGDLNSHDDLEWENGFEGTITMDDTRCVLPPGQTSIDVTYNARISKRVPTSPSWLGVTDNKPVVLFMPGGRSTSFVSQGDLGGQVPEVARNAEYFREFQDELYNAGARILEIRFKCAIGPNADDRYEHTGPCMNWFLTEILKDLETTDVEDLNGNDTGENYWPSDATQRFAWGISQGQTELQFAIDKSAHQTGIMNRVVFGGGGTAYDAFDLTDCTDTGGGGDLIECAEWENDGCVVLGTIDFYVEGLNNIDPVTACGGCWGRKTGEVCQNAPGGVANCEIGPPTVGFDCPDQAIDDLSILPDIDIGTSEDATRILGAVLANTGFDLGENRDANLEYMANRDSDGDGDPADDDNEAIWNFNECICDCAFDSHGPFSKIVDLFRETSTVDPIDDWVDFFISGDMVFDFFEDVSDGQGGFFSPESPPNTAQCLAPPYLLPLGFTCSDFDVAPPEVDNPGYYPACGS